MARYENIVGNKYGKLLVVGEVEKVINGKKRYYVECVCDCGNAFKSSRWVTIA